MKIVRYLGYLVLLLVMATQAVAGQIRVSDTDYRTYRTFTLPSGLEVLLVHDQRAAKAAAAVALPVGSLDDAPSQPGLAHYLEHMLFLGSQNYPDAEAYQSFITRNGGQTNAATAYTSTTYMMEVDPPAFAEAFRRMVDTLARPLLDPTYADKERNAVNAELESKKHSDGRRMAMLQFSTLNPEHPATHFTGGNLQTLSDKPGSKLHEELVRFHQTWYSANLMKAVLYGPQSLDDLEKLARTELPAIPDRGARVITPAVPPVTDAEQGIVYGVRPVRETRSLSLEFVLPQDLDDPAAKPLQVAASVLGAETKGSLVDLLRTQGWALSLSAGGDSSSLRNGVILSLFVQLTEDGYRHRDDVLQTMFAYFDTVRRHGISQDWFEQQRSLANMQFKFAPLSSGFDYVADAADTMLEYPVEDVNYGPYRLDRFDRQAVNRVLAALTPQQARIFVVGPDQRTDRTAFFYETPYSQRPVTAEEAARWITPPHMKLTMPALNPFVPDTFALVAPEHTSRPVRLAQRPGLSVWHGQSDIIREPKAIYMIRLQSGHIASTVNEEAMQGLLLELWNQEQSGLRYQAQEGGLSVSVSGDEGFVLNVEGFSQRQPELVPEVLAFLNQPVDKAAFERARAETLRALANRKKQNLFGQAMGVMRNLLTTPSWNDDEIEAATRAITPETLSAYMAGFREDLRFTVFGYGNVTSTEVLAMSRLCEPYIGKAAGMPTVARRILPVQGVVADSRVTSELEDSVLVDMYLDPQTGPEAKARMLLLEGLLSTRFYSRLRTEEQLGYVVSTFPLMYARAAGIGFGVQSPVRGTAGLMDRFQSFYVAALRQLRSVTAEEMESVRQGVLATLTRQPDTLEEAFGWLDTDLRLGNSRFDGREQIIQALRKVPLHDVIRTYERIVLGPGGTRSMVQVQGSRFVRSGWATQKSAVIIPRPEDFHRLVDVQEYRGL